MDGREWNFGYVKTLIARTQGIAIGHTGPRAAMHMVNGKETVGRHTKNLTWPTMQ
jgi:hypothetical protein